MWKSSAGTILVSRSTARIRSEPRMSGVSYGEAVTKAPSPRVFKIIVVGDSDVGKTCLTFRFCSGHFPNRTEATIGVDFREKTVVIDDEPLKLQLWDTAGQERFRKSMVPHYYRNVHAVVFVYDVTKPGSFESLIHWIEECDQYSLDRSIPRILVGNKCDIPDAQQVDTNVAQRFADAHIMPLFETSAKDDSECNNVDAIFLTLAHKLRSSKPMMGEEYPSVKRATVLSVDKEIVHSAGSTTCSC